MSLDKIKGYDVNLNFKPDMSVNYKVSNKSIIREGVKFVKITESGKIGSQQKKIYYIPKDQASTLRSSLKSKKIKLPSKTVSKGGSSTIKTRSTSKFHKTTLKMTNLEVLKKHNLAKTDKSTDKSESVSSSPLASPDTSTRSVNSTASATISPELQAVEKRLNELDVNSVAGAIEFLELYKTHSRVLFPLKVEVDPNNYAMKNLEKYPLARYETTLSEKGKEARLKMNIAERTLENQQNPPKSGLSINFNQFFDDTTRVNWDDLHEAEANMDDATWNELAAEFLPLVYELFPDDLTEIYEKTQMFIQKSMQAKDARTDGGKAFVRQRVATVIDYVISLAADQANPDSVTRAQDVIKLMADGGAACPDRVMAMLTEAENFIKIGVAKEKNLAIHALVNSFKMNAIMAKMVDQTYFEAIQSYLYYSTQLSEVLDLGVKTKKIGYPMMVKFELPIDQAIDKLFTAFTEEDLIGYVSGQEEWRKGHKSGVDAYMQELAGLVYDLDDPDELAKMSQQNKDMLFDFCKGFFKNKRVIDNIDDVVLAFNEDGADFAAAWSLRAEEIANRNYYGIKAREELEQAGFLNRTAA